MTARALEPTADRRAFVLTRGQAQFGCESMVMRFNFKRGHWQSRFMLAKGNMSLEGCKVKTPDGTEYPVVKTTQEGPLWLSVREFEARMTIQIGGLMLDAGVDVDDDGTADCSFQINEPQNQTVVNPRLSGHPARIVGEYDNGTVSGITHLLEVAPETTCNLPGFTRKNSAERVGFNQGVGGNLVFTPAQQITWDKP